MKLFKITLLILSIVLISGCTSQKRNIKTSEIFKNTQQCYGYKKELETELEIQNTKSQELQGYKNISDHTCSIGEIFYSPSLATCLYVRDCSYISDKESVVNLIVYYGLIDILHNKTISSTNPVAVSNNDYTSIKENFFKDIENYKK